MHSTVRDQRGHAIYLTDERWQHICEEHPEIQDDRRRVLETVRRGQRFQDSIRPDVYLYYRDYPDLLYGNTTIVVVVRFGFDPDGRANNFILMTHEPELRYFHDLPARLYRGESSALAIARHRSWLLLTDDRNARQEAMQQGIMVAGSIGCLVLAVDRGHCSLSQANSWLDQMIGQGYHSPVTDLSPLIKSE